MKTIEKNYQEMIEFLIDCEISINEFYNIDITQTRCTLMGYADYTLINKISKGMMIEPKLNVNNHFEFVNKNETIRIVLTLK
jgi:hypothetical protein